MLTVVVWVICAGGVISAIVSGAGILPVVLLSTLGWFVWLAFWRPCVVTDTDGVELHNLVRDVSIPYGAIEQRRHALRPCRDRRRPQLLRVGCSRTRRRIGDARFDESSPLGADRLARRAAIRP